MPAQSTDGPVVRAVLLSLSGIFLLDCMGAIIKYLSPDYPASELAVFRNCFGMIPTLAVLWMSADWQSRGRRLGIRQWRLALLRGGFVTFAQFCFYLSLGRLEFATVTTIAFASPMIITALSVPVLGDRVGAWRWSAVGIGFAGVIMVMQPGSDVFTWDAVLPLGAALGYGAASVTVRLMDGDVPTPLVNLYSQSAALVGAVILTVSTTGFVPVASASDMGWIVAMGVVGGSGVLLLTMAYRSTQPSNLAPFDYTGLLFAFALGWIFFGEAPIDRLFPGVILIVGGGLLIVWRERRRGL